MPATVFEMLPLAALLFGLPLSYIVWFPLGFSNERLYPFWQGFLLLFGLGFVIVVTISLLTPPEPTEVLRTFHRACRPPGLWGPVIRGLDPRQKRLIREETVRDLIDCGLGILCAATAIVAVISPLAGAWGTFAAALTIACLAGTCFIRRWTLRGVFRGMSATEPEPLVEEA